MHQIIDPQGELNKLASQLVKADRRERNPASWMRERLVKSINKFESRLDREQEVGLRLVHFGIEEPLYIQDIGCQGPDLIVFRCETANREPVELHQHYSQVAVMLIAIKRRNDNGRIGFRKASHDAGS